MRLEQQPAYVLHARAYRETSLLLECLTRDHGRIGVVARGVRRERAKLQRAQLEPFQPIAMDLVLRGELATLRAAEPVGLPLRLTGDAGLAGLYVNELVVRLTARQDPLPELFEAYARTLGRLHANEPLAWTLRRFERDMLEAIGYGLQLSFDGEHGEPLDPEVNYRYEAEAGAIASGRDERHTVRGEDLLALAEDRCPGPNGLIALRRMMRQVIGFHLGGGELRAWRVLGQALTRR